jgi:hypothetical protein
MPLNPERVSITLLGAASTGQSTAPMEASGFVIFESAATNLVAGDTNGRRDIFVTDIGDIFTILRVNTSTSGAQATGGDSRNPSLSRRCVDPVNAPNEQDCDLIFVYESAATNLDSLDANGIQDVFESRSRSFIRGDVNENRLVNSDDLTFLERSQECPENPCGSMCEMCPPPACDSSADIDDDGGFNSGDFLFFFNFLNMGGPPPPHPFPACGKDRTTDGLSCGTLSLGGIQCEQ